MSVEYDGAMLLDSTGEQVGKIERTYLDEGREAQFLEVRTGRILAHHHLVPADQAEELPEGVRVPYTRDVIEESPAAKFGETLESEQLDEVRAYYAQDFGAPADAGPDAGVELRNRPPNDFDNEPEEESEAAEPATASTRQSPTAETVSPTGT